jgi:hypothetical protein
MFAFSPLGAFKNPGIYSGTETLLYGDVGHIMRFQTQPIVWESGRGGEVADVVRRERLGGTDEQTRRAIIAHWEAEAMTERQLRWNRQTQTDTPVPGYRDDAHRAYSEYADDFKKSKTTKKWLYYAAVGVGIYYFLLR